MFRCPTLCFVALAWLFGTVALDQAPVSRLTPQERAQIIAIGKQIDASMQSGGLKSEVAKVENIVVPATGGPVSVRIYRPQTSAPRGTVLFIHGGAFIAGSIQTHDNMARLICSTSGANVVSVEYTRAPNAMHPTQINQVRAILAWLSGDARKQGLEASPLAVCGDSAGGHMSAVIARESKDIAFAVLVNPVVDMTLASVKDPETRFFTEMMIKAYVPKDIDLKNPSLSPLLGDVPTGHPATFIAIGDSDPWRPEQDLYVEKLKRAGVRVEVFRAPTGHLGPDGALATPTAVPTLTAAGRAIKAAFAQ